MIWIDDIVAGLSVGDRWGVSDGQLEAASKIVNSQIMSQEVRKFIDGETDLDTAANTIVERMKAL